MTAWRFFRETQVPAPQIGLISRGQRGGRPNPHQRSGTLSGVTGADSRAQIASPPALSPTLQTECVTE